MKGLKIAGLCFVAIFALSTIAEGTASAAFPEFIQCRKITPGSGSWKNSQCSEAQSGGEWATRAGNAEKDETFSSTSGIGTLETVGGKILTCQSDRDMGAITGPKEAGKVVVTFFGCEEPVMKVKCNSTGRAAGEITTKPLKGKLGFLNKAEQQDGLLLEPESGTLFVEFKCTVVLTVKIEGSVIGEVGPINKMSTTGELHYEFTPKGKQKWTEFENEKIAHVLETTFTGGSKEVSAISGQAKLTFQFDTEIRER